MLDTKRADVRYEYFRSVVQEVDEQTNEKTFIGYLSLTKYELLPSRGAVRATDNVQFTYTLPANVTPLFLLSIPSGDLKKPLKSEEYEYLLRVSISEPVMLWRYFELLNTQIPPESCRSTS